jgi:hypothetical protein
MLKQEVELLDSLGDMKDADDILKAEDIVGRTDCGFLLLLMVSSGRR